MLPQELCLLPGICHSQGQKGGDSPGLSVTLACCGVAFVTPPSSPCFHCVLITHSEVWLLHISGIVGDLRECWSNAHQNVFRLSYIVDHFSFTQRTDRFHTWHFPVFISKKGNYSQISNLSRESKAECLQEEGSQDLSILSAQFCGVFWTNNKIF